MWIVFYVEGCGASSAEYRVQSVCREFFVVHSVHTLLETCTSPFYVLRHTRPIYLTLAVAKFFFHGKLVVQTRAQLSWV